MGDAPSGGGCGISAADTDEGTGGGTGDAGAEKEVRIGATDPPGQKSRQMTCGPIYLKGTYPRLSVHLFSACTAISVLGLKMAVRGALSRMSARAERSAAGARCMSGGGDAAHELRAHSATKKCAGLTLREHTLLK